MKETKRNMKSLYLLLQEGEDGIQHEKVSQKLKNHHENKDLSNFRVLNIQKWDDSNSLSPSQNSCLQYPNNEKSIVKMEIFSRKSLVKEYFKEDMISIIKASSKKSDNSSMKQLIRPKKRESDMFDIEESIKIGMNREWGWASVLIVDDQVINRMILKEFGLKCGVNSDEAENGKIAYQKYIETLRHNWWDGYKLILMDLNMPVMDGISSASKILQESFIKPKIIALTAFWSEEEKVKCFEIGMAGFQLKPINFKTYTQVLTHNLQY